MLHVLPEKVNSKTIYNKIDISYKNEEMSALTNGNSSFGAMPDIITKYRKITFKLFCQNWHNVPQISSISLVCASEYCKK